MEFVKDLRVAWGLDILTFIVRLCGSSSIRSLFWLYFSIAIYIYIADLSI